MFKHYFDVKNKNYFVGILFLTFFLFFFFSHSIVYFVLIFFQQSCFSQPRPRELFRSPSAPPLVPSKKSLFSMNRSKHRNKEDTPQSRRHKSFFPTLHESVNFESDDEPISTLNRLVECCQNNFLKSIIVRIKWIIKALNVCSYENSVFFFYIIDCYFFFNFLKLSNFV